MLSRSLLLNHLEPQSNKSQTLTTHNASRHCRVRLYTFAGQPLSKQLYLLRYHSILTVMNGRHVNTAKFVWPVGYRIDWFLLVEP